MLGSDWLRMRGSARGRTSSTVKEAKWSPRQLLDGARREIGISVDTRSVVSNIV